MEVYPEFEKPSKRDNQSILEAVLEEEKEHQEPLEHISHISKHYASNEIESGMFVNNFKSPERIKSKLKISKTIKGKAKLITNMISESNNSVKNGSNIVEIYSDCELDELPLSLDDLIKDKSKRKQNQAKTVMHLLSKISLILKEINDNDLNDYYSPRQTGPKKQITLKINFTAEKSSEECSNVVAV